MADYTAVLISLFGSGNILLLAFIVGCAVFGAIKGTRGEMLKFFLFISIIGLTFLAGTFITTITTLAFCFYYGKKIYKGIKRE
jgi:hypothetical protein